MSPAEKAIWQRRVILMAVVGVVVAIPVTLALRSGNDGTSSIVTPDRPRVGELEFNRDIGIELQLPKGWKRQRKDGAVIFRSDDRRVLMAISALSPMGDTRAIVKQAISTLRESHEAVEVIDRFKKKELGGRPAQTAVLSARHPDKGDVAVLIAAAEGENLTYLAQVFAAAPNPGEALSEAQSLLNRLRLAG